MDADAVQGEWESDQLGDDPAGQATKDSCAGSEPGSLRSGHNRERHLAARERRRSTMKRGVALTSEDDTLQTRTGRTQDDSSAINIPVLDRSTGDDGEPLVSDMDRNENDQEGDSLLSAGDMEQPRSEKHRRQQQQHRHRQQQRNNNSREQPENNCSLASANSDKWDLVVSREPTPGGRHRTRTFSRNASEMSSGYGYGEQGSDDGESGATKPDRCDQYLELCRSFWKPCCPTCKRGQSDTPTLSPTRQRGILKYEESIIIPEDPFRKRCIRACMTFIYVLLVFVGVVVTYSMLADLVESMNNPVRSIHYHKVENYEAPGIAVYPGGAEFLACGHYYNNVVTSKVRLSQLDLVNHNCSFTRMQYRDPHYPDIERDAIVIRGPTSFINREAIFLHFALEDETRDFFTVSYFVFPNFDQFNASEDRVDRMLAFHRYMPTFALSAGLRMWIKLIMSETYLMDDSRHTEFNVEYSVVRFIDRRPEDAKSRHLFFIFFEWKNDIIEQSRLLYSTTPWSIGAGLCGVFLTLHRVYQLAQTSYRRMRKDQQRRSIRKRTLRELRQRSMDAGGGK